MTHLTHKIDAVRARARRLAEFGAMDDSMTAQVDATVGDVEKALDKLDNSLKAKLGVAERDAFNSL